MFDKNNCGAYWLAESTWQIKWSSTWWYRKYIWSFVCQGVWSNLWKKKECKLIYCFLEAKIILSIPPSPSLLCSSEWRKPKSSDSHERDSAKNKRKNKFETDFRVAKKSRHSNDKNSNVRSERGKKGNKSQFKSFTEDGGKRRVMQTSLEKDKAASPARRRCLKPPMLKRKFKRNWWMGYKVLKLVKQFIEARHIFLLCRCWCSRGSQFCPNILWYL